MLASFCGYPNTDNEGRLARELLWTRCSGCVQLRVRGVREESEAGMWSSGYDEGSAGAAVEAVRLRRVEVEHGHRRTKEKSADPLHGQLMSKPDGRGLWRSIGSREWDVFSAGSEPAGFVHPMAIEAMRELNIDLSDHTGKHRVRDRLGGFGIRWSGVPIPAPSPVLR
jgi:hypothetical protein